MGRTIRPTETSKSGTYKLLHSWGGRPGAGSSWGRFRQKDLQTCFRAPVCPTARSQKIVPTLVARAPRRSDDQWEPASEVGVEPVKHSLLRGELRPVAEPEDAEPRETPEEAPEQAPKPQAEASPEPRRVVPAAAPDDDDGGRPLAQGLRARRAEAAAAADAPPSAAVSRRPLPAPVPSPARQGASL